ncbi:hypothetical protein [Actinokineospora globicatena]|uniref:hypothetical protein n=1 Tax=Actinokineospora globicatena TaxID=103729 RepID=UPI0020A5DE46|nr:hypothetical protein [Actinokineospora globicatena]MCP2306538.1 hypothetical protein [Actinokineospora globicatena]GLW81969.1 hypothetical protein Aglo01_64500 [Actinokineospora globicatena]GLW88763.1 hypothetical protein Aglo02_64020 [Actinokineospora globicatena]
MFTAGPPSASDRPARLVAAHARVFAETSPTALDPALRPFLADLVRPYGNALREDLLTEGVGHSFGEMAEAMLPTVVGPDEPVDLLVLAFAMHDLRLGRATACYLSDQCPGAPMAFAVCDQGSGAAFTALRLTESYLGSGACERALVVVVEQSALHYEPGEPAPIPDRHTGVVLRLERTGSPVAVGQHTGVDAQRVTQLLRHDVARLGRQATVVASARLAEAAPGVADVVADAGQPYTGIWCELADGGYEGVVLVADYEPSLGLLCTSTVDFSGNDHSAVDSAAVAVA